VLDVLKIGGRHGDPLQGVGRRVDHLLSALASGVEDHIVHLVVLAIHLVVVVDGLHAGDAPIGVVVQRLLELALLGGNWRIISSGAVAGSEMSMRPMPASRPSA